MEQQLRTQEQLQQLAAVAVTATASQQQQQEPGEGGGGGAQAAGASPTKQGTRAPPLGVAVGLSPPNSQRKLLAHLSVSMRPADREVRRGSGLRGGWRAGGRWESRWYRAPPPCWCGLSGLVTGPTTHPGCAFLRVVPQMRAVAALTWPKLQEWYCQLLVRLGCALPAAPFSEPCCTACLWRCILLTCLLSGTVRAYIHGYASVRAGVAPAAAARPDVSYAAGGCREAVVQAAALGPAEADANAKEALKCGVRWRCADAALALSWR